jgi:hypothetical protein
LAPSSKKRDKDNVDDNFIGNPMSSNFDGVLRNTFEGWITSFVESYCLTSNINVKL